MKRCTKCGCEKPADAFDRQAGCRGGRRPECKDCRRLYFQQHRQANHAAYIARGRAKYRREAESVLDQRRKPCARCGEDKGTGERRQLCEKCRTEVRAHKVAYAIAWQKANPEATAQTWRRKTAKRRARTSAQFVEDVQPLVLLERDDGVCGICGQDVDPLAFQIDHVVPLSKGGAHSYRNTQVAHPSCNARKGARIGI